ncbi:MAG: peptidylprolyl isomerase [Candidatus Marinimicrobia bacterium]|nr:peptidylprolyl isomerase [Candidatus Neomarinimicrobiota bacterium]
MIIYKKTILLLSIIFISFFFLSGCVKDLPHYTVAHVGGLTVSSFEFEEKYKHHLLKTDIKDSPEERINILEKLISKKLLANAWISTNIPIDSIAQTQINEKRNTALRDALYKHEILIKPFSPSDSLLKTHFLWKNTDVFVRHIFSLNILEIDSIYKLISKSIDQFDKIAQSTFKNKTLVETGGELGWVSYNQMDPTFEIAMYNLPIDSISNPVRSAYGWHIIQVLDKRVQGIISESDYEKNKLDLKNGILYKKRQIAANNYVNNLMESANVNINDTLTNNVLGMIAELLKENDNQLQESQPEKFIKPLLATLKILVNENLAVFDLGAFTVGDFISRLHLLPTNIVRQDLLKGFYYLLRDKVLEEKARNYGLENDLTVLIKTKDAEDDVRASLYLSSIKNDYHIKSGELKQLTDSLRSIYNVSIYKNNFDLIFQK